MARRISTMQNLNQKLTFKKYICLLKNTHQKYPPDKPMSKNVPAGKAFTVEKKEGDVDDQQELWVNLIAEYEHFSNDDFIHDFFGKMTREQIGIFAYKHSDHHLRQFGV